MFFDEHSIQIRHKCVNLFDFVPIQMIWTEKVKKKDIQNVCFCVLNLETTNINIVANL